MENIVTNTQVVEKVSKQKVFGPLELPSGKMIYFRRPLSKDRQDVMSVVDVNETSTIMFVNTQIEDLLHAKCVTKIDDKDAPLNYAHLFDVWTDEDTNYYEVVFNEMFGMTMEKRTKAKEAAAFLLKS